MKRQAILLTFLFSAGVLATICFSLVACNLFASEPLPAGVVYKSGGGPFGQVVAWSSNGSYIAAGGLLSPLRLLNADSGSTAKTVSTSASDLAWSPDSNYLAVASIEPTTTLRVWDLRNGGTALSGKASYVTWSDDGRLAVAVSGIRDEQDVVHNSRLDIYDYGSWTLQTTLPYSDFVGPVAWAPDSRHLAFGSMTGSMANSSLAIWDLSNHTRLQTDYLHNGSITDIAWSPDGRYIASSSDDRTVRIWDGVTYSSVAVLNHLSAVNAVAWSPDSKKLASAASDGTVRIWDVAARTVTRSLLHYNKYFNIKSVAWSPDGNSLASLIDTGELWVWDVR